MKEVFQIIAVCIAVLYSYNFVTSLITGKKNLAGAMEWVSRGYCFGIGLSIAFVVLCLAVKIFAIDK